MPLASAARARRDRRLAALGDPRGRAARRADRDGTRSRDRAAPARPAAVRAACTAVARTFRRLGIVRCSRCWWRHLARRLLALFVVSSGLMSGVDATLTKTDAIVVLTGAAAARNRARRCWPRARRSKLFISGVNQRVDRDDAAARLGPAAERAACCIVLGHDADNTVGNARETAGWMQRGGLSQPAPGHELVPHAAQPAGVRPGDAGVTMVAASGVPARRRAGRMVRLARRADDRHRRIQQISRRLAAAWLRVRR